MSSNRWSECLDLTRARSVLVRSVEAVVIALLVGFLVACSEPTPEPPTSGPAAFSSSEADAVEAPQAGATPTLMPAPAPIAQSSFAPNNSNLVDGNGLVTARVDGVLDFQTSTPVERIVWKVDGFHDHTSVDFGAFNGAQSLFQFSMNLLPGDVQPDLTVTGGGFGFPHAGKEWFISEGSLEVEETESQITLSFTDLKFRSRSEDGTDEIAAFGDGTASITGKLAKVCWFFGAGTSNPAGVGQAGGLQGAQADGSSPLDPTWVDEFCAAAEQRGR